MNIASKFLSYLSDLSEGGGRFAFGGIMSKFSSAETIAVKLPANGRVFVRPRESDFATLRQVFIGQEYRLPATAIERVDREYQRICASGMIPVIVDAGANIGAASIWLKARFPEATIIAIEPDPSNAFMARKNLAGLQDVVVMEAAIGGEPGFVSIVAAGKSWAVQTERAEAGCAIVTIDQAVATITSGKLLIVKIDIEGFESDLFDGDLRWLDDAFVVYIEPHDWMLPGKGSSRSFQAAFGERDFEIFLSGENLVYVRREQQCSGTSPYPGSFIQR